MEVTVSKLIAGFLLGVIATIAVVFLLDGNPREIQESPPTKGPLNIHPVVRGRYWQSGTVCVLAANGELRKLLIVRRLKDS